MLETYQTISLFPVTATDVISNLLVALVCGIVLSLVYRMTYRGPSYSVSFVNALVILTIISALVILVIGNNLARAFGLVGAMSIIRFRTAVRDTMDMVYIFVALALGMACGVGLKLVALIGTALVSILIILLTFSHFGRPRNRLHLLQVVYAGQYVGGGVFDQLLSKYCRQAKLVSVKNVGIDNRMESTWQVLLKRGAGAEELVKAFTELNAVENVNLFFDEDDVNSPTL
jgi:hypothetical protein